MASDEPGTIIADKYVLMDVAGSGGMATVWRATQHTAGFQRTVAIKRIKENIALDPKFVELFVEEARVSANLVHPNVVQIHDFGADHEGRYYLVMEWIEGLSLAQYTQVMEELGLYPPWELLAGVAIEALRGLAAAHDRVDAQGQPAPIFHRDVTPQNILISVTGVVKLTDFGLARASDRSRLTAPETIKGKVGYLAPEMTEAGEPSRLTDIYALGVVLWQALTGRRLFEGDDPVEIFMRASQGEIPPIAEWRPDVPVQFTAAVERALAFDPADRFQSAQQMSRVITNLLRTLDAYPDAEYLRRAVVEARAYREGRALPGAGGGW